MGDEKAVRETLKSYYPQLGRVMPDGKLSIPFAAWLEDGEHVDGTETIDQDDSRYAEWLELAKNRDQYLERLKEERKKARAERRARSKNKNV
jgi:hypothetical protein